MKATISFFSVLVLTALIGFSFVPEKSNAFSNETSISGCVVNGCAPAYSTIKLYSSNGKLLETAYADANKFFRLTQIVPGDTHRVVCTNGNKQIGCTATINGVTCSTPQINFCASGIIWDCY